MKVIAITNRKGGVGKSTMASHIAAGLAIKGYRVGMVDTDSQGNGGLMLGVQATDGLFNLLIEKHPLDQIAQHISRENYGSVHNTGELFLIPSADMTHRIPYALKDHESFLFLETMEAFANTFRLDYIIIDTNPSLSLFDASIYLTADGFIYVTECEHLSLDGVKKAFLQMKNFGSQRQKYLQRDTSQLLGIIPNKYRRKTVIHQENLAQLRDGFGHLVWEPVALRTLWTEASTLQKPVFVSAPKSEAAQDAIAVINRTEQELIAWHQNAETI